MAKEWFRKILSGVSAYLVGVLLLAFSSVAVFHFVITDAGEIKSVMDKSGAYESFVGAFIDETSKNPDADATIPLENPKIKTAINEAFPPKSIQKNTENFIDGTYDWLHGETSQPQFTLDLTENKNAMANKFGNIAQNRAQNLPPCGYNDIPQETAPFKIECLPPGITPSQINSSVTQDIRNDAGFLPETKITPSSFSGDNTSQNFFEQSELPESFQLISIMFWILLGLIIVFASLTVFLAANRLKGLKRLSKSFLIVGAFILLTPLLYKFFFSRITENSLFSESALSNDVVIPIFSQIISSAASIYYIIGGVSILLGIAGMVAAHRLRPKESEGRE